jgi:hypothetical protein
MTGVWRRGDAGDVIGVYGDFVIFPPDVTGLLGGSGLSTRGDRDGDSFFRHDPVDIFDFEDFFNQLNTFSLESFSSVSNTVCVNSGVVDRFVGGRRSRSLQK